MATMRAQVDVDATPAVRQLSSLAEAFRAASASGAKAGTVLNNALNVNAGNTIRQLEYVDRLTSRLAKTNLDPARSELMSPREVKGVFARERFWQKEEERATSDLKRVQDRYAVAVDRAKAKIAARLSAPVTFNGMTFRPKMEAVIASPEYQTAIARAESRLSKGANKRLSEAMYNLAYTEASRENHARTSLPLLDAHDREYNRRIVENQRAITDKQAVADDRLRRSRENAQVRDIMQRYNAGTSLSRKQQETVRWTLDAARADIELSGAEQLLASRLHASTHEYEIRSGVLHRVATAQDPRTRSAQAMHGPALDEYLRANRDAALDYAIKEHSRKVMPTRAGNTPQVIDQAVREYRRLFPDRMVAGAEEAIKREVAAGNRRRARTYAAAISENIQAGVPLTGRYATLVQSAIDKVREREQLSLEEKVVAARLGMGKRQLSIDSGGMVSVVKKEKETRAPDQDALDRDTRAKEIRNARAYAAGVSERIRAGERVLDQDATLIKSTLDKVKAGEQLNATEHALASRLGMGSKQIEVMSNGMVKVKGHAESLRESLSHLRNAILVYGFGFQQFVQPVIGAMVRSVGAAAQYERTTMGTAMIGERFGVSRDATSQAISGLTKDGLMSVTEAAKGLGNILATGIGLPKAVQLMETFKDSASLARQGNLELGEAVVGATDGYKNMMSRMVDNAGITKNLSVILSEQARALGKNVSQLSELERYQLIANGLIKEGAMFMGGAAAAANTMSGKFDMANFAVDKMSRDFGLLIASTGAVDVFTNAVIGVSSAFSELANNIRLTREERTLLAMMEMGYSNGSVDTQKRLLLQMNYNQAEEDLSLAEKKVLRMLGGDHRLSENPAKSIIQRTLGRGGFDELTSTSPQSLRGAADSLTSKVSSDTTLFGRAYPDSAFAAIDSLTKSGGRMSREYASALDSMGAELGFKVPAQFYSKTHREDKEALSAYRNALAVRAQKLRALNDLPLVKPGTPTAPPGVEGLHGKRTISPVDHLINRYQVLQTRNEPDEYQRRVEQYQNSVDALRDTWAAMSSQDQSLFAEKKGIKPGAEAAGALFDGLIEGAERFIRSDVNADLDKVRDNLVRKFTETLAPDVTNEFDRARAELVLQVAVFQKDIDNETTRIGADRTSRAQAALNDLKKKRGDEIARKEVEDAKKKAKTIAAAMAQASREIQGGIDYSNKTAASHSAGTNELQEKTNSLTEGFRQQIENRVRTVADLIAKDPKYTAAIEAATVPAMDSVDRFGSVFEDLFKAMPQDKVDELKEMYRTMMSGLATSIADTNEEYGRQLDQTRDRLMEKSGDRPWREAAISRKQEIDEYHKKRMEHLNAQMAQAQERLQAVTATASQRGFVAPATTIPTPTQAMPIYLAPQQKTQSLLGLPNTYGQTSLSPNAALNAPVLDQATAEAKATLAALQDAIAVAKAEYDKLIGNSNGKETKDKLAHDLDDIATGFGQIGSAASSAANTGIKAMDRLMNKTAVAATAVANMAGAIKMMQGGPLGMIAGGLQMVSSVVSLVGLASKPKGESSSTSSRMSKDYGATISRGPTHVYFYPTLSVSAEGDVIFSEDGLQVVMDRFMGMVQQSMEDGSLNLDVMRN